MNVEKSYGVSPGDSDRYGFPDHFVVNSGHENNSLYPNNGSHKMNETGFFNSRELYDAYDTGGSLHGPNMENYAGSMAAPTGSNMSGIKTSTMGIPIIFIPSMASSWPNTITTGFV